MNIERAGPGDLPPSDTAVEILRRMVRIRLFDEATRDLHAAAQIPGPVHLSIGQEAEIVGACMALRETDTMTGNHRSHGHPIGKGAGLNPLMAELLGKRTGVCHGKGGSMHLAAFQVGSLGESGIVGAGLPIATGAGLSAKLRGAPDVSLCFFGDGAANAGTFHESLNLAAVWKLPVIYLCENNGYAVTARQSEVTAIENIADRAIGYGIPGRTIDGQDAALVFNTVSEAAVRARAGEGPTLIDAKTYRYYDHAQFGGLGDMEGRSTEEVDEWRQRDPIQIFLDKLLGSGAIDQALVDKIYSDVADEVSAAVQFAESSEEPHPSELLEDLFG